MNPGLKKLLQTSPQKISDRVELPFLIQTEMLSMDSCRYHSPCKHVGPPLCVVANREFIRRIRRDLEAADLKARVATWGKYLHPPC